MVYFSHTDFLSRFHYHHHHTLFFISNTTLIMSFPIQHTQCTKCAQRPFDPCPDTGLITLPPIPKRILVSVAIDSIDPNHPLMVCERPSQQIQSRLVIGLWVPTQMIANTAEVGKIVGGNGEYVIFELK